MKVKDIIELLKGWDPEQEIDILDLRDDIDEWDEDIDDVYEIEVKE